MLNLGLKKKPKEEGFITEFLCSSPKYKTGSRKKSKITPEVQVIIDELLEENKEKKRTGLGKQILKGCDIHEFLIAQGKDVSYATVCNYIRSKRYSQRPQEAYIRQEYQPAESCEFDWGG